MVEAGDDLEPGVGDGAVEGDGVTHVEEPVAVAGRDARRAPDPGEVGVGEVLVGQPARERDQLLDEPAPAVGPVDLG